MQDTIDRILEGKFEYESGELAFSESRIEIESDQIRDLAHEGCGKRHQNCYRVWLLKRTDRADHPVYQE